jgi:putative addiction module killer protein
VALPHKQFATQQRARETMDKCANCDRAKYIKPIDGTLREFRIDWGPGIRIYLLQDGDKLIVLLGGGTKNSQKADIKRAGELRDEYFARKSGVMKDKKG